MSFRELDALLGHVSLFDMPEAYERGSMAASLFRLRVWRSKVLVLKEGKGAWVLDAGSGRGLAGRMVGRRGAFAVQMDASYESLKKSSGERVQGVFSSPPFRPSVFDAIIMSFSLHMVVDKAFVVAVLGTKLKKGGEFFVLDIARPKSRLIAEIFGIYTRFFAPMMAFLATGRDIRLFCGLHEMYASTLSAEEWRTLLTGLFAVKELKELDLGIAFSFLGTN
ncbi:MAG: methyltransferase domain-containing protein [Thermoprotei archaeon]